MPRFADTPSQRWAAAHAACFGGRRRLGRLSIGEYWRQRPANVRRVDYAYDLLWVAGHLARDQGKSLPGFIIPRSASGVRAFAVRQGITFPAELL